MPESEQTPFVKISLAALVLAKTVVGALAHRFEHRNRAAAAAQSSPA